MTKKASTSAKVPRVPRPQAKVHVAGVSLARSAKGLLRWYGRHKRDLPWRDGVTPYETLLSELMLQQTVVATVIPYFQKFRRLFPNVHALAGASEDEVMKAWAGLGYYSRARNLHRAAKSIVEDFDGKVPSTEDALRTLPGVGPYTAAAVAAIAFGRPAFAMDGNVIRVASRFFAEDGFVDKPETKTRLHARGTGWVPEKRAGDFAQALMELGATVCTPKNAKCGLCPIAIDCAALAKGAALVASLPRKQPRPEKKRITLLCLLIQRGDTILLSRRAPRTLLGGTWFPPFESHGDGHVEASPDAALAFASRAGKSHGVKVTHVRLLAGVVGHIFTHIDARAYVVVARASGRLAVGADAVFSPLADAPALSSFARKLLRHADIEVGAS